MMFEHLNDLSSCEVESTLLRCCGARRWAAEMAARRPFPNDDGVVKAAEEIWWSLDERDWLEAFAAHPRIGDKSGGSKCGSTSGWASSEQAGVRSCGAETLKQLGNANTKYEARFGHIFIVCAAGKSGAEMLAILRSRLDNPPETEIRAAAAEQLKITKLRLQKLER